MVFGDSKGLKLRILSLYLIFLRHDFTGVLMSLPPHIHTYIASQSNSESGRKVVHRSPEVILRCTILMEKFFSS